MTHSLHRDGDSHGLHDDYVMLVLTGLDRAGDSEVKRQMREVWDILASAAAKSLRLLDSDIIIGIPLSTTGKNPFVGRL